jgi:predicted RND superfamily exporter protein
MRLTLTNFSLKRPWIVILLAVVCTTIFAMQFPKVKFDNDPENMLSKDEHIRIYHNEVKARFALYDFVIVGIVNDNGVFNVETLTRIDNLTKQLLSLYRNEDGEPTVKTADGTASFDLSPQSAWQRALAVAFRHDSNRLFDDDGDSAIIGNELISPSVVDSIKQGNLGSLKLEYLMERPPTTPEEALEIGEVAMGNPLYNGTLVAEDEKAICIYIPIKDKTYSYNVAALVTKLTESWTDGDKVFITGQPVAQDTFGVEMLVQMATSAPLAGLAIFLLLLLFFRRISLIIAPMIVAIISVICTMGLLIGLGFDVHIMSSMIAIFLMPIAVADSVHVLSEFFDIYHQFGDKKKAIRQVINHLFRPMLYTSLTTIAGFASLAATPIPPVRVFGLHVAFGVGLAWLLTMTLVPAYIMIAVPKRMLDKLTIKSTSASNTFTPLSSLLDKLGQFTYIRWKAILVVTLVVIAISIYGIGKITVNDNPVKWFTPKHPIRIADKELNSHFGGTYTAYLTLSASRPDVSGCDEKGLAIRTEAEKRFRSAFPEATDTFIAKVKELEQLYRNARSSDIKECFIKLANAAEQIDGKATATWNDLADEINYLEPAGLTHTTLVEAVNKMTEIGHAERTTLLNTLKEHSELTDDALLDQALAICDTYTSSSFRHLVLEMEAELSAPLFKQPEMLLYVEQLQAALVKNDVVGKTSSAVDALKKASYELSYAAPPADASPKELQQYETRNEANRHVPSSAAAVGQVFTQLEGMKKKDSLFHLITKDYQQVNIWVQLTSGDNVHMEAVVQDVEQFFLDNPSPVELNSGGAGLTYLHVVWQDKMVRGMLSSLLSSFVVVLIMMMILFRSPLYGALAMLPLTVTISFIYGLIGLVGKDYDMPVAILSALTLGLSVDFAIHFLERAREEQKKLGSWASASTQMFKEPAVAISRNAITISIGFTPLLLAPLVPYKTVGFFLATIMAVSWLATLFLLPALLTMLKRWAFKQQD